MQSESMYGDKIWGAPAIAQYLGVSVDTVYSLAVEKDVPVYKPGARYFALKSELRTWLRRKPAFASVSKG